MTSLLETVPVSFEDLAQHPTLRNLPLAAGVLDDLALLGVQTFKHRQRQEPAEAPKVQLPTELHGPADSLKHDAVSMLTKKAALDQLAQDVHAAAVEAGLAFPREEWVKAAFVKLAGLGALVMLPTGGGKYLMQKNGPKDWNPGKLRPPGGHHEKEDDTLEHTIVRELQEEFDLKPEEVRSKVKFLGREYRKPLFSNGIFELKDHGLKPGTYQASNHPDEKIELVECTLADENYVGPMPWKLLSEEAHLKGLEAGRGDKVNKS